IRVLLWVRKTDRQSSPEVLLSSTGDDAAIFRGKRAHAPGGRENYRDRLLPSSCVPGAQRSVDHHGRVVARERRLRAWRVFDDGSFALPGGGGGSRLVRLGTIAGMELYTQTGGGCGWVVAGYCGDASVSRGNLLSSSCFGHPWHQDHRGHRGDKVPAAFGGGGLFSSHLG